MLYIEVNMNNHTLTYIEDDIQYPVLTLKRMILGRKTTVLEKTLKIKMKVTGRNDNVT